MNASQRQRVRAQAQARIDAGEDPQGRVHVLYYPADYEPGENDIQGLSNALSAKDKLDGYAVSFHTLAELAACE